MRPATPHVLGSTVEQFEVQFGTALSDVQQKDLVVAEAKTSSWTLLESGIEAIAQSLLTCANKRASGHRKSPLQVRSFASQEEEAFDDPDRLLPILLRLSEHGRDHSHRKHCHPSNAH